MTVPNQRTPPDDGVFWPPPLCDACRDLQCRDCVLSTGCEHMECHWLYEEDA